MEKIETFIHQEYLTDLSLCDDLISFFEENRNLTKVGRVYGGKVDPSQKDSIDMRSDFVDPELTERYYQQLDIVVGNYSKKFKYAFQEPFSVYEHYNIQYYRPSQGAFHAWHCERTGAEPPATWRHLVWMTYLNDVDHGGETEFYYQDLKVKPRKGLTLIWPADWTHVHRGRKSKFKKYIITGWFNYIPKTEQEGYEKRSV